MLLFLFRSEKCDEIFFKLASILWDTRALLMANNVEEERLLNVEVRMVYESLGMAFYRSNDE